AFLTFSNRRFPSTGDLARFAIYAPEKTLFSRPMTVTVPAPQFAISSDGHAVVLAASAVGAKPMLWLRSMTELTATELAGTENAQHPFWSPDSQWIGFFSEG